MPRIYLSPPHLSGHELEYLQDAVESNWIAPLGPQVDALEPITDERRGGGSRTLVWIEGIPNAIVASRTERTILHEMGQDHGAGSAIVDEALGLAERLAEAADQGKVDLNDLGRRARGLLEKTSQSAGDEKLF